ncbi:MAG: archaellin/type IV pilin N-terminal domain-containing protein, partial [Nitrososphaerota archaeon]
MDRRKSGISPVVATVILVAVAIVIAIAVAFWASGLV